MGCAYQQVQVENHQDVQSSDHQQAEKVLLEVPGATQTQHGKGVGLEGWRPPNLHQRAVSTSGVFN
jgi:hypothetical protein